MKDQMITVAPRFILTEYFQGITPHLQVCIDIDATDGGVIHEVLVLSAFSRGIKFNGIKVSVEVSKPESGKLKGDKKIYGSKDRNFGKKKIRKNNHKKRQCMAILYE